MHKLEFLCKGFWVGFGDRSLYAVAMIITPFERLEYFSMELVRADVRYFGRKDDLRDPARCDITQLRQNWLLDPERMSEHNRLPVKLIDLSQLRGQRGLPGRQFPYVGHQVRMQQGRGLCHH